jgi:hypothetical protein
VRVRPPRVLDSSSLVDLFHGHRELGELLDQAEAGWLQILIPAAAIADAEAVLNADRIGWEPILLTPGVHTLPLTEHAAIEVGGWPGTLAARHVAHEAAAVRSVVVTRAPGPTTDSRSPARPLRHGYGDVSKLIDHGQFSRSVDVYRMTGAEADARAAWLTAVTLLDDLGDQHAGAVRAKLADHP